MTHVHGTLLHHWDNKQVATHFIWNFVYSHLVMLVKKCIPWTPLMLKLHTNSTYQAMITLLTGSWLSWTNFLYAIQRFKGHSLLLTDWKRHRYNRADHTEMHLSKRVQHIHAQEVHGGVLWVQSTAASCKKRQGEHLHSSSNLWLPMARKSRHAPGLYCTCTIGFKGLWWPECISNFNVFGRAKPVYIKLHEGHTTPYTPSPVSEEWDIGL